MLQNVICVLTSCNIRLKTYITVHHQCHNKFVTKSAKCPRHMTKSIEYKCAMTVLRLFLSFSPKMFKQIVHPIYLISHLNVLYRIVSKKLAQYTALLHTRDVSAIDCQWRFDWPQLVVAASNRNRERLDMKFQLNLPRMKREGTVSETLGQRR